MVNKITKGSEGTFQGILDWELANILGQKLRADASSQQKRTTTTGVSSVSEKGQKSIPALKF